MIVDALILDFDGTLADTRDSIIITVKETLKKFGIIPLDESEVKKMIGLPLIATFEKISPLKGADLDKAIKEYRSLYDEIAQVSVTLFPGVKNTLRIIYEKGIKLAVASSKGKAALVNLLKNLDVIDLFACIAGEQDVVRKKPAPDMVNFLLEKLNAKPTGTMVVGDTRFDVIMGKAAGCQTCAVTYGNHSLKELLEETPDFIINRFPELLKILGVHPSKGMEILENEQL